MENETTIDRISSLPEPIIHHILSFLPTKDVKVTSSLSKTWYGISKSFPYLDFDEPWNGITPKCYFDYDNVNAYFGSDGSPLIDHEYSPFYHDREPLERDREHLDKYVNYVGETLRRFNDHNELDVRVRRLSIPIIFFPRITTPLLDTWISLVMQHPIEEFNLKIRYPIEYYVTWPFYDLPPSVFASKSIKVVKLCVCSLLSSFTPNMTSNLVKLSLWYVVLDDIILSSIISTCPFIEELSIVRCIGIKCLRISDLNKLKSLWISHWLGEENEIVEIDAPSLQSLKIDEMDEIRVLECPKLTHLDLEMLEIREDFLQDFLSRLSFLRSLSLSSLSLTKVKISSDTLNKLRVVNCCTLVELEIDAPNLLSVEYEGDFIPLSWSVHKVTGRWHVSTYYCGRENPLKVEDFLVRLREFVVSKLKHLEYLSLDLQDIQPCSFEELNERAISQPAINIGRLDLRVYSRSEISYPDILDCVLCSCHPRTLSLRIVIPPIYWNNNNIMMSIHDVIMRHRRCSFPCKLAGSWFHCVEGMMYEARDGSVEECLPMDGISSIRPLRRSDHAIKFIFRW